MLEFAKKLGEQTKDLEKLLEIDELEKQGGLLGEIWVDSIYPVTKLKVNKMLIEKQEEIKELVFS